MSAELPVLEYEAFVPLRRRVWDRVREIAPPIGRAIQLFAVVLISMLAGAIMACTVAAVLITFAAYSIAIKPVLRKLNAKPAM